jgi:hypothetical protein
VDRFIVHEQLGRLCMLVFHTNMVDKMLFVCHETDIFLYSAIFCCLATPELTVHSS